MTDYRDPNYRDPMRPDLRDPALTPASEPWSNATWGWIAGIAIVVLVLAVMFTGGNSDRIATDATAPDRRSAHVAAAPPMLPKTDAPTMNRPAPIVPEPSPAPAPAPQ